MNSLKKVILISAGDPASISTEITIKAIENSKIIKSIRPIVISSPNLIEDCKNNINSNIKLNKIKDKVNFSDYKENHLNIIPINLFEEIIFGKPNTKYASFIKKSIVDCVRIKMNSIASAIVTNPINK
jgi:4-hydroxy-L-threonine phosphate dehydrogenase PdxA